MSEFLQKFTGSLAGVMQWQDLHALWQRIGEQAGDNWYLYHVGDPVPESPASQQQLQQFMQSIDELLHREHAHDYCGIVYVDDSDAPTFVKIYDPNNLGVVCGYSDHPPLPGWVMSQSIPQNLQHAFPPSASRKRWWQKIFS